jgi:hypothetical protein
MNPPIVRRSFLNSAGFVGSGAALLRVTESAGLACQKYLPAKKLAPTPGRGTTAEAGKQAWRSVGTVRAGVGQHRTEQEQERDRAVSSAMRSSSLRFRALPDAAGEGRSDMVEIFLLLVRQRASDNLVIANNSKGLALLSSQRLRPC